MPVAAILAALISAFVHASWNALLKGGRDRLADSFLTSVGGALFGSALVLFAGLPATAAWPFLIASMFVHCAYWTCLIKAYDAGDLSHVYTLSRGSAPVLVAVGAAAAAREIPSLSDATGIALVSAGVLCVGVSRRAPLRATFWALATGTCIASYSLIDALGARASGDAAAYVGWGAILMFVPLAVFAMVRRGPRLFSDVQRDPWRGLTTGVVSSAGFGIVLWAQTFAPIAQVTALRETSVVFAALLSWLALEERMELRRWLGALIVAAGALLIGLS